MNMEAHNDVQQGSELTGEGNFVDMWASEYVL